METVRFLVNIFYLYLLAGVVFAVLFLWRGAAELDDLPWVPADRTWLSELKAALAQ